MRRWIPFCALFFCLFLSSCTLSDTGSQMTREEILSRITERQTPADGTSDDTPGETPGDDGNDPKTPGETPAEPLYFEGVFAADLTVVYDGEEHFPVLSSVPDFAAVTVAEGGALHVGEYDFHVTVRAAGYHDLLLTAKVTVLPASFDGVTFRDVTVGYDGNAHTLSVSGLPEGAAVRYADTDGCLFTGAADVGTYTVTAELSHPDYRSKTLTATLTVRAAPASLSAAFADSGVYYADPSRAYALSFRKDGKTVALTEAPVSGLLFAGTDVFYLSDGTVYRGRMTAAGFESAGILSSVAAFTADENALYYAKDGSDPGVFRLDFSTNETTRLCAGVAAFLTIDSEKCKLYFTNSLISGTIYCVSATAGTETSAAAVATEADGFAVLGGKLYYAKTAGGVFCLDTETGTETALFSGYATAFSAAGGDVAFLASDTQPTGGFATGIFLVRQGGAPKQVVIKAYPYCGCPLPTEDGLVYYDALAGVWFFLRGDTDPEAI